MFLGIGFLALVAVRWTTNIGRVKHYGIVIIRIAQGMGVFNAFVESQGADLSLKELSSKVKGDEKLLSEYPFFFIVMMTLWTYCSL